MNIRTLLTMAVAVLLGLIAVFLVRNYVGQAQRSPGQAAGPGGVKSVVVAAAPIQRGAVLAPNLLKVVNYPADAVPPGSVGTVAELGGPGPNGRLSLRTLSPNEPILMSQVTGPGGKLTLSGVVAAGMRAVSVRSSDVAGVAGFVLPGDRVDILLTRGAGDQGQPVTQVLAENVRVLGIDQMSDDAADKPAVARTVTVEMTPDQAHLISLAQAVGSVSFTLRHVADEAPLEHHTATVADLAIKDRLAPPVRARSAAPAGPRRAKPPAAPDASDQVQVHVTRGLDTAGYSVAKL
ncbi:MAG: Flp pilus assembly protein CpaB [Caulobacteraceae bacterium]